MKTKRSSDLTLRDRLSRLDFATACKLLGTNGGKLLRQSAKLDLLAVDQVKFADDAFRATFPALRADAEDRPEQAAAEVLIRLSPDARRSIRWSCSRCDVPCLHTAAAFSLILEEKTLLGLARAPEERIIAAELGEEELIQRAIDERAQRARDERMRVQSADASRSWTDYVVTSETSGKSYRVALRGREPGQSYCSCPDFRTNTLGTCKHILKVLRRVERKFPAEALAKKYVPRQIGLHLHYHGDVTLRWELPHRLSDEVAAILGTQRHEPLLDIPDVVKRVARLQKLGQAVTIYPDAEEFI